MILAVVEFILDTQLKNIVIRDQSIVNINFHNVAIFDNLHPDTLKDLIPFDHIISSAKHVRGDPNCIYIQDKLSKKKVGFCLNNPVDAMNTLNSIQFFINCHKMKPINKCKDNKKSKNLQKNSVIDDKNI